MMHLRREEKGVNFYNEHCEGQENIYQTMKTLTIRGIAKYGCFLVVVELSSIISIYLIRSIIDYIQVEGVHSLAYSIFLFLAFCLFRLVTFVARNYYDQYSYAYFRYVQNAIQAWIYRDVTQLRMWQLPEGKRATILNILTKDVDVFTKGSWQFPYLVVVPINSLISAIILYSMYGAVILLCYVAMLLLLWFQQWSNKKLSLLQYNNLKKTDQRVNYLSQVIKAIKSIKC
mmetsp:Transcript_34218/g.33445  ORF Transcript_34218/g.33445 Transcript_34218/m.33445 type:complete len:230 (-) Transcript_34218:31-720(-)